MLKEKIKNIITDINTNPENDPTARSQAIRRYIQFCYIMAIFFLFMSLINIYSKSWLMLGSTMFGAIVSLAAGLYCSFFKKEIAGIIGICASIIALFSFYAIVGGNSGFSILWLLLIPTASMLILDFKSGMLLSTYFVIFLCLIFYTPLNAVVQYNYNADFSLRFPLLYIIAHASSGFGFYKLHQSKLQNYRQQQALLELKQEADAANNAKSRFLANMSHEIRTPINGILGMDAMLMKECRDGQLLEYAKNIQSASQSLLSIVNDILDISKIESGKMDILPVEYDLFSVLNDCYNMNYFRAQDKALELRMDINPQLPSGLSGDEVRVRQVINNLLSNAVKYTKEGHVTLSLDYQEPETDQILLMIKVHDTGIGIREEDLGKLFASFQRIEEKRNRSIEGTGLGLNLTKALVEMMDGEITVESVYGKGSVFTAKIPQKVTKREPLGDFARRHHEFITVSQQHQNKIVAPEAKILVVDDVEMNLKVMRGLLKETRIQVDTALNGRSCLALVQEKQYDIIFLDHMMPEMDGIETLHQMRQMPATDNKNLATPVIILTANAVLGAKEEYLKEGFSDYLSKPVQEESLTEMLGKHLRPTLLLQPEEIAEEMPEGMTEKFAGEITEEMTEKIAEENAEESAMPEKPADSNSLSAHQQHIEPVPNQTHSDGTANPLAQYDFLDIETGLAYCIQNEDFYLEMIGEFKKGDKSEELRRFFKAEDWANFQITIHALKSTSLSIGAVELSEQAKALELACKEGNIEYIKTNIDKILKMYETLLNKIPTPSA